MSEKKKPCIECGKVHVANSITNIRVLPMVSKMWVRRAKKEYWEPVLGMREADVYDADEPVDCWQDQVQFLVALTECFDDDEENTWLVLQWENSGNFGEISLTEPR